MRCAQHFVLARSSLSWYIVATSHVLDTYYLPEGETCISYGGKCGVPRKEAKLVNVPLPNWKLHRAWNGSLTQREELTSYVDVGGGA
jgi:hypothetical protein